MIILSYAFKCLKILVGFQKSLIFFSYCELFARTFLVALEFYYEFADLNHIFASFPPPFLTATAGLSGMLKKTGVFLAEWCPRGGGVLKCDDDEESV